jgi:hypothetical protein
MKKTAPDGVTLGDQLESSTSAADQMIREPDFGFDLMMPDAYMGGFGMEEGFGFPMGSLGFLPAGIPIRCLIAYFAIVTVGSNAV